MTDKFNISCKNCGSSNIIAERQFNSKVNNLFLKCLECKTEELMKRYEDKK